MAQDNALPIAIIGFSEAGQAFAAGLRAAGAKVTAADLRAEDPDLQAAAGALGITCFGSAAAAGANAEIVLSLVTAGAAVAVAELAGDWLRPGQTFVDLNSTGPKAKQAAADAVARRGAGFVEGAIMSPVAGRGHATPILVAGPTADALAARLNPLGMDITPVGERLGAASATKMCRSIVMKGIEAIVVESLLAARHWDVADRVLDSLADSYPGIDWPERARYLLTRVLQHGPRRAAELHQAADMVTAAGGMPTMATAIATLMASVGEQIPEDGFDLGGDHHALAARLAAAAPAPAAKGRHT